ncbi:MAG: hypothetical protein IJV98_00500, partial [Clostridia bacterium]|nr:hypothetical protein [Clostridia bacterium]
MDSFIFAVGAVLPIILTALIGFLLKKRAVPASPSSPISAFRADKHGKPDLAVLPRHGVRKATIGEHLPAGVARFFALLGVAVEIIPAAFSFADDLHGTVYGGEV